MVTEPERRYLEATDLRVITGEGMRQKLVGHAIVFNTLSEPLMFFREQIAPEAVDRTLNERIDMRALIDHETSKLMGRLTAGTLRVKKDQRGLLVEIDPPDTSYSRDALESVRRGDLTGMSFAFRIMPGGDQWDESTDPPTRTVTDMRVSEVSIVTFPAYSTTDVDVAQRSLNAFREQHPYQPSLIMRRRMLDLGQ